MGRLQTVEGLSHLLMASLSNYDYHQPGEERELRKGRSEPCSLSCLKFSLYCYNILLLLFGLAGLSAGLWSLVDRGQFLSLLTSLNKSVSEEYGVSSNNDTRDAIDDLQSTFRCCGADSFEDWRHSQWWRSELKLSNKVPDSCCKTVSGLCGVRDHPSNIYYPGCAHKLSRLVGDHLLLIGSIALVICLVESAGVILSVKLVRKLRTVGD